MHAVRLLYVGNSMDRRIFQSFGISQIPKWLVFAANRFTILIRFKWQYYLRQKNHSFYIITIDVSFERIGIENYCIFVASFISIDIDSALAQHCRLV